MKVSSAVILVFILMASCTEKRQSFVFILVDDLGWSDVGYNGSTFYETPHIDALSQQSIQFTNAYSSGSVCSPSRASIMTGRHPARLDITDWIPGQDPKNRMMIGPEDRDELQLEEVTLAEKLKEVGYSTFFAGKWHLGGEAFLPEDQGFDVNLGGFHVGSPPGGYYVPYKNPKLQDGPPDEYLTDRLTSESIQFLDGIGDDPFFLFVSYYTVHTPIQANRAFIEQFESKLKSREDQAVKTRVEGEGISRLDQLNPAYASMVFAMDMNVGLNRSMYRVIGN